jgi:hypothetical protein
LAIFTAFANEGLSRYGQIALMADNDWEWDDRNQTDLPIGKTAVTSGQQDYSFSTEHSFIEAVEFKDTAGNWYALKEIDERYFTENNKSITEYASVAGLPLEYRKVANSVILYPAPNFTDNAGDNTTWSLKVHFKRGPSYYTTSDTTKVQGFTDLHSNYLTDYTTWKYANTRNMPIADKLRMEIQIWEEQRIPEFYAKRSAEHSKIIRSKYRSSR